MSRIGTYRLLVQYDGRPFCGWQRQPNGLSVQECIERALATITCVECQVQGAGRTDAGVHALGQVASFTLKTRLATAELRRALNAVLPVEIRIASVRRAPDGFHARKHAVQKAYRYLIVGGRERSPFIPFYATWLPRKLDEARMREAAALLVGRHDFSSFRAAGSSVKTSVRDLRSLEVKRGGGSISIIATADGFLRHMVRNIAGTLIDVGVGRLQPADVGKILRGKERSEAGPTAPAEGLTLLRVDY